VVRETTTAPLRAEFTVGSDLDYAGYQEWGTGPIRARRGGVLAWRGRGGGMVFARSTSGVPAVHYMARAARAVTLADFV
jgi:hypothetical protein